MKNRFFPLLILLAFAALLFRPAAAHAEGGPTFYTIRQGDTLASIAAAHGVSIEQLITINHLRDNNRLYVGQRLVIRPAVATASHDSAKKQGVYVVRRGDTLSSIARKTGVSVAALQQANNLHNSVIYVGQRLKLPQDADNSGGAKAATITHTVRRGETLTQIAAHYGVPESQIIALNHIKDPSLIRVGETLVISGQANAGKKKAARGAKKLVVSISKQRCWRYEGDTLLNTWRCSTGRNNSTKTGSFRVQSKLRKAYGSTWNIWMPYWLGIYWSGPIENGIHGLPWNAKTGARTWAGLVGTPITYGCVMLNDKAAKTVWEWADIGTRVIIKR